MTEQPWWYPDATGGGVIVIGDQSTTGVPGRSVRQWEGSADPGAEAMPGDTWIAAPTVVPVTRQVMLGDRTWVDLA
jgi:hypothetical protein